VLARPQEKLQGINVSTIPASLRALLSGLIDYAGLFPPAALDMKTAVRNYAGYLAGPDAWVLGRFVLPVSRFAEFEAAIADIHPVEPWGISALIGASYDSDLAEVDRFNQRNSRKARVDSVEAKASTVDEICQIRAFVRGTVIPYFEIPPDMAGGLAGAIRDIRGRAKIRTGGVTPGAFPSSESIARFLLECANQDVAFKATAGLHHPIRCVKALTYDAHAPKGMMHGFLNLFMAAIAAKRELPRLSDPEGSRMLQLQMLLDCKKPKLEFTDDIASITAEGEPVQIPPGAGFVGDLEYPGGMSKNGAAVPTIQSVRRNFAISFGSCSFEEPLADMRELKLL
jgi:hypothetical protein